MAFSRPLPPPPQNSFCYIACNIDLPLSSPLNSPYPLLHLWFIQYTLSTKTPVSLLCLPVFISVPLICLIHLYLIMHCCEPECHMDVVQPQSGSHRIYLADQVWWSSLSLPSLQRDFLYCHQQHGIFTSPGCSSSPPFPLPKPFSSLESTQTATQADHTYPWLTMVPTAPQFDNPLLDGLSLKSPRALEIVTISQMSYHLNGNSVTS